jgi:hypothetical protein
MIFATEYLTFALHYDSLRDWSGASVGRWGRRSRRQRDWCATTEPKGLDWSGQIGAEGGVIGVVGRVVGA